MTGTQVLSHLVRPDVAKELTFTGRIFDGTEAFALGLATRFSDDPLEDAMTLAREIAGRSPHAVRGAKALFNRIVNAGAAEQFHAGAPVIGSLIGQSNQVEAVTANFENRDHRRIRQASRANLAPTVRASVVPSVHKPFRLQWM